jgi:hypothetical protein
MFTGIGSFAFLTAVAASAIVVREVDDEEREIELEERDILRVQEAILARLVDVDRRLERLEHPPSYAQSRGPPDWRAHRPCKVNRERSERRGTHRRCLTRPGRSQTNWPRTARGRRTAATRSNPLKVEPAAEVDDNRRVRAVLTYLGADR